MYKVLRRKYWAQSIYLFEIEAPLVARKEMAGKFVFLRIYG
jgi:hypothetical protein